VHGFQKTTRQQQRSSRRSLSRSLNPNRCDRWSPPEAVERTGERRTQPPLCTCGGGGHCDARTGCAGARPAPPRRPPRRPASGLPPLQWGGRAGGLGRRRRAAPCSCSVQAAGAQRNIRLAGLRGLRGRTASGRRPSRPCWCWPVWCVCPAQLGLAHHEFESLAVWSKIWCGQNFGHALLSRKGLLKKRLATQESSSRWLWSKASGG
jgi:hypothetical protein